MTQTTVSPARRAETAAQLRRGRILRTVRSILRHLLLALLAAIWLVPILWLLVTSFSTDRGINVRQFFPASYTLRNYVNILFHPDSVAQFPRWFTNTLVVACFNCVISTCFVLMVAYALSCCRFKGRKLIQNLSVSVNLFPGVLAMIAVYFVLKYLNLTNSYAGLIMVYAGSSGLGYLICKGFFDTIPISLREAAKLDGASDARVFFQVVLPMSKPILVYTIISFCLANPPFKGTVDAESINDDLKAVTNTKKTELLFLALFLRMLKTGGRCACIVPDGVLFGSSKAHQSIRKELIENHQLRAVISMPSGVFKPYAGVSTAVLVFTKTGAGGTDKVWFYDMKADGFSLDDKRTEVKENDIPDIIARFHNLDAETDRKRTEQSFFVPKAEIAANGYDLSINKYKETEYVPVEYPSTTEILADLHELEMEITKGLAELEEMV